MDFIGVKRFLILKLKNELSHKLYYHSVEHTLDVLCAANRLAKTEKISDNDLILLKTAALFHDAGLIEKYKDHEEVSARIAKEILPDYGYTITDIETVSSIILTTKLPQQAQTQLEKILCDADLDYLGRSDFFMIAHTLRYEWEESGYLQMSLKEWYQLQFKFLNEHRYFTYSANDLRFHGKQKNLNEIKELLNIK